MMVHREAGGGFSFPVTPKQSSEPQSHPPPFKSWPSVRSSFTSEFAAASDDDHNAADYADEGEGEGVEARECLCMLLHAVVLEERLLGRNHVLVCNILCCQLPCSVLHGAVVLPGPAISSWLKKKLDEMWE